MNPTRNPAIVAAAAFLAFSAAAQADYTFTFSGSVLTGTDGSTGANLAGSSITFQLFVSDLAADLTPASATANYAISSMTIDVGSNGVDQTIGSGFSAFSSVYLDPGATQLVGGSDLFGSLATFVLGVNLPSGAFADVKNLAGQPAFSLAGLTSSSFSYFNSAAYTMSVDIDAFSFDPAVVPLPTPVAMTGLGLLGVGVMVRRRSKRLG